MNLTQPQPRNKSRLLDVFFSIYVLTLITLLLMPTDTGIKLNKYFLGIRTDHFIHASLFLPFMPYFRLKLKSKASLNIFLKFFMLGVLFAISCESLQLFVPYRSFDPSDIVANIIGVSIGGLAFLWKTPAEKD